MDKADRASTLESEIIGPRRCLTMPGVSANVGVQIESLRGAAGDGAVALIRLQLDEATAWMVDSWPRIPGREPLRRNCCVHIEDELGGVVRSI